MLGGSGGSGLKRPSRIFVLLVAAWVASAWLAWTVVIDAGICVFAFVTLGWLVSLCVHEYAHAVLAYRGGDRSVVLKGYLTLDPRRYSHPLLSIVLPVVFVLLGGFGLPGGAVWINRRLLLGRLVDSLVSAAGPAVTVAFGVVLAGVHAAGTRLAPDGLVLWVAVAFLAFLQVTAAVLNLLPVPGLDGFGIVEPWLPERLRAALRPYATYGLLLVFAALWIPPISRAFFDAVYGLTAVAGVDGYEVAAGRELYQFWLAGDLAR
jgi:Zn-dependent protease